MFFKLLNFSNLNYLTELLEFCEFTHSVTNNIKYKPYQLHWYMHFAFDRLNGIL